MKKSIFKKWWVWAIIIVLLAAFAGGDSEEVDTKNDSIAVTEEVQVTEAEETKDIEQKIKDKVIEDAKEFIEEHGEELAEISMGRQNALNMAYSYLDFMSFSYSGLIEQLEFEGFDTTDAIYAADNCGADWNEQAAEKAESYLDFMSFSREGLIDQLIFEGFTAEQAEYGVTAIGY